MGHGIDLKPLLEIKDLTKVFPVREGILGRGGGGVRAVDRVSITIQKGEVFGLVGESGCGKTTLGRMILKLLEADSGNIYFDGHNITALDRSGMKTIRGRMQTVFQDPFGSLNPRKTINSIVGEPLRIAGVKPHDVESRIAGMLEMVGLGPESAMRYPHEFSGGQRQRIGIARALILRPELLVADEPVSALDVSIQAQILNLLMELKSTFSLTLLFISHDLRVVRSLCDRVAVMYLGRIVEVGPAEDMYLHPVHPYTEALIKAIPEPDPELKDRTVVPIGEVPSPINPPSGCHFHPRCPLKIDICPLEAPPLSQRPGGRLAACHVR